MRHNNTDVLKILFCRFVTGETFVVDGANWMWKPPVAPREAIANLSRGVESKSRAVGLAPGEKQSKL
jgi:hypothetical protein